MEERELLETFKYHGDKETLGARWSSWLERFKLYIIVKELTDPEKVKAAFLLMIGPEVYEIYRALRKSDMTDTTEEIYEFLSDFLNPKRSRIATLSSFRRAGKRDEETFDEFVLRLRLLAANCDFGKASVEENIVEQFIAGCGSSDLREQLLLTSNLDLTKALQLARDTEDIILFMYCRKCGGEAHRNECQCPARNKICVKCQKKGHFGSECHRNTTNRMTYQNESAFKSDKENHINKSK